MAGIHQLRLTEGPGEGQLYILSSPKISLGRDVRADIPIVDPQVSRFQATISQATAGLMIEDAGSTNGTFVNGQRIHGPVDLNPGDVIAFGDHVRLTYQVVTESEVTLQRSRESIFTPIDVLEESQTQVFISYSRKDKPFVQRLHAGLIKNQIKVWVDWEGIPISADWWFEIQQAIESSDAFLFIISPDSLRSKVCGDELNHAVSLNKRLIPVLYREPEQGDPIQAEISSHNWIFMPDESEIGTNLPRLVEAIRTDLDWVRKHTRLLERASEWKAHQRDSSFLLRGLDLESAEKMLHQREKEPLLIPVQVEYIQRGQEFRDQMRRNELAQAQKLANSQRQRSIVLSIGLSISTLLGLVACVLSVIAFALFNQSNQNLQAARQASTQSAANAGTAVAEGHISATAQARAEEQARIARLGELSLQVFKLSEKQFDLSLLLSVEVFLRAGREAVDLPQSRNSLFTAWESNPQFIRLFDGHEGWAWSAAFSPDGKTLVSGGLDGSIRLWDAASGRSLDQGPIYAAGQVRDIAFIPDGRAFATASGTVIQLWDLESQELVGTLDGHRGPINSVVFGPEGRIIASGSDDGTIRIWDLESGLATCELETRDVVFGLDFLPRGTGRLVSSGGDQYPEIGLWDIENCAPLEGSPLIGHHYRIWNVAINAQGTLIASASDDHTVRLWEVESGRQVAEMIGHNAGVVGLAFSPDGRLLASSSWDNTIRLWDGSSGESLGQPLQGINFDVFQIGFNPLFDGTEVYTLASAGGNGTIGLWQIRYQNPADVLTALPSGVLQLRHSSPLSDQEPVFVSSEEAPEILVFVDEQGRISSEPGSTGISTAYGLAFRPRSDRFSAVTPDGRFQATGNGDVLSLWDLDTHRLMWEQEGMHGGAVLSLSFNHSGSILASGTNIQSILLWDTSTGELVGSPLQGHSGYVYDMRFSPDGTFLASASGDGTLRIWDLLTGEPVGNPLTGHLGEVWSLAMSPDGFLIASLDANEILTIWPLSPVLWARHNCERAGRNFTQGEWLEFFPGDAYQVTCPQWPPGD